MKGWVEALILLNVTVLFLGLLGISLDDYFRNNGDLNCSMTFPHDEPDVVPVPLPTDAFHPFNNYRLYLYCEGRECIDRRVFSNLTFEPGDIPVLYVPGNADSHMQIRSVASVALGKSRQLAQQGLNPARFRFFTIDFQSELSGFYGPVLYVQAAYVKYCINYILTLFDNIEPKEKRPDSVVLFGNSMGGVVSRGVFLPLDLPMFPNNSLKIRLRKTVTERTPVHTIFTLSTPHRHPVVSFDQQMYDFYARTNKIWLNRTESLLNETLLVSLHGGRRDTMVRSDLANLNDWKDSSAAGIIFANSESTPFVWKSIDHIVMPWCRELVLQIVRSLYDMIDPETQQLTRDRSKREAILRHYFERDAPVELLSSELTSQTVDQIIPQHHVVRTASVQYSRSLAFDYNQFNSANTSVVFDLHQVVISSDYDSLFMYTNIGDSYAFLLCKSFDKIDNSIDQASQSAEHNCTNFLDLFTEYGRTIAAVHNQKSSPIRVINVEDIPKLVRIDGFKKLVLVIPARADTLSSHQIIVKLDWYIKRERQSDLASLPGLFRQSVPVELGRSSLMTGANNTGPITYRRIYLPKFNSIVQAFELVNRVTNSPPDFDMIESQTPFCDDYLRLEYATRKPGRVNLPISLSTMFVLFSESVSQAQVDHKTELVINNQANVYYNKVLKLRLTANVDSSDQHRLVPYLEFIQFDVKHLLHERTLKSMQLNDTIDQLDECRTYDGYAKNNSFKNTNNFFTLEYAPTTVLAQYLRYYYVMIIPFIVLIIQFYDAMNLNHEKYMNKRELAKYKSKLIFHNFHARFLHHLVFSTLLTIIIYFFQSDFFGQIIGVLDQKRSFFARNDYEILRLENLADFIVPFLSYWCAFGALILATFIISCILQLMVLAIKTKRVIFAADFNDENFLGKLWLFYGVYLLICIVANLISSAACQIFLIVGELFRLSFLNPAHYSDLDDRATAINRHFNYSNDLTRFFLYIMMLVLNFPSLIVWSYFVDLEGFKAFGTFIYDSNFTFSMVAIALNLLSCFRRAKRLRFLTIKNRYLIVLVSLNLLLGILFSSVNIYRMYYFILIHLFFMCLCDYQQSFELVNNRRQNFSSRCWSALRCDVDSKWNV